MKKGFNAILSCQFIMFALALQNYVFSVRSLIVGTAFTLILLPLLIAQLFGAFIARFIHKLTRKKITTEAIFLFSIIGFALFTSALLIPDRIASSMGEFLVFRMILLFSYLLFSFSLYFGLALFADLKQFLDSESYYDLIRATFAGIFVGITYNLVIRSADLALNSYLLNTLSIGLVIASLSRYFLVSRSLYSEPLVETPDNPTDRPLSRIEERDSGNSNPSNLPSSEKKEQINKDQRSEDNQNEKPVNANPIDDSNSKISSKSALRNLLIFSIMWAFFMMPINNPELFSYMSGLPHQWVQYIFVITSIVGLILGVKANMMKYLRNEVYATLQSYLPVFTLISIGLFGLYLFYPPGLAIYILNYSISILIFAIIVAISFFEMMTTINQKRLGLLSFLVFFMQTLHVSLRIIMIERHMPYIWTLLLMVVGLLQYWNYHVEYRKLIISKKQSPEATRSTEEIEENKKSEKQSEKINKIIEGNQIPDSQSSDKSKENVNDARAEVDTNRTKEE